MKDLEKEEGLLTIQKDILWGMYQEHRTYARHYEVLRSTVSNILSVVSAGLISLSIDKLKDSSRNLSIPLLLILVGGLGIHFSLAHMYRYNYHSRQAHKYYEELDKLFFDKKSLTKIGGDEEKEFYHDKYQWIIFIGKRSNQEVLWMFWFSTILIIGIVLTVKFGIVP